MRAVISGSSQKGFSDRSEQTRASLIEAGMDLFGAHGFDATTTRALADAAGANLAAIPYHFGGKEGLYRAVAAAVIQGLRSEMDGFLNDIQKEIDAGLSSPHQAMALVEWMMEDFTDIVLARPQAERWVSFLLREKMSPSESFDLFYDSPVRRMRSIMVFLLARVSGMDAKSPRLLLTALQLQGLVYTFRTSHESTLRDLGWKALDSAAMAEIRTAVLENTRLILKGLLSRR